MRLFTAIELSDEARAAIVATQRRIANALPDAARSLRFVTTERLHLTLAFLGETSGGQALEVAQAMQSDIPIAPFELAFGGLGTFPPRRAPRILWLGVREGAAAAVELQKQVIARLASAGVAVEDRPFSPHLTLARWREAARSSHSRLPVTEKIVARVMVEAVTLFESRLSSAGPTYTALARAFLRCL